MSLPAELQKALKEGKVIPFVEAGVSMSVTRQDTEERLFPSWKELLERAAGELKGVDDSASGIVAGLLDKSRYLEAATEAHRFLGGSRWPDFLQELFRAKRSDADPNSLALAQAVWRLGSTLVITTNYDDVLKWAHENSDDVAQWKKTAVAEQAQSLREMPKKPTLWHLHGHIDDIRNIVLTEESYTRLYDTSTSGESENAAAREALRFHLASKCFLFIGYSLDDYPFVQQVEALNSLFEGFSAHHFALLRQSELARFDPKNLAVTPVCYTDHGSPLLELMAELAGCCNNGNSSGTGVATEVAYNTTGSSPQIPKVADFSPQKPAWNMRYRKKGNYVVGRDEMLDQVRKQLVEGKRTNIGQTAAFQGLGGLGKTQMAIEYAWEYRAEYPAGVIWLNADQDLAPQLSAMAIESGWVSPQSDSKTVFDIARQRMRNFHGGLIVFDNLEDRGAIRDYLPDSDVDVHVLVTSRGEQPGFVSIKIALLNPEQAEKMLVQESGRLPQTDAEGDALHRIVTALDGLPLALELVGAYMARRETINWVQYAVMLDESIQDTLNLASSLHDGGFTKHETNLFHTLRLSEALISDNPLLQELLRLLAWSGTAAMGFDLLRTILGGCPELVVRDALALGVSLCILKCEGEDRYALHRLIRHVQREDFRIANHEGWASENVIRLGDWFENHRKEFMELAEFEAEIDHLHVWLEQWGEKDQTQSARLLWLQAYPPFHRGQFEESARWLQRALKLLDGPSYESSELRAHILSDLGTISNCLGKPEEGLIFNEKALEIRSRVLGEEHQDTAFSLNSIGASLDRLGRYAEALEYEQKALDIQIKLLGETHADTALTLSHIGASLLALEKVSEALVKQEQALRIRQSVLGRRHPHTADSLHSVGNANNKLGRNDVALAIHLEALEIHRETLGNRHLQTATSIQHVAAAFGHVAQYDRSIALYEEAIDMVLSIHGRFHPLLGVLQLSLGGVYYDMQDYSKSLDYRMSGLNLLREALGEQHEQTAQALNYVGISHFTIGNHKEAAKYAKEALEIQDALSGIDHPSTLRYAKNAAVAYAYTGQGRTKSLPIVYRVLKALPKDTPEFKAFRKLSREISNGKRPLS